jgi:hypothetical protein
MICPIFSVGSECDCKINIIKLADQIKVYLRRFSKYIEDEKKNITFIVEMYSTQLLVVWIGYCCVYMKLCQEFPLFNEYDASLDGKQLRNMVLVDGNAVRAALNVA